MLSYTSPEWVYVNSHHPGDPLHLVEGSATLVHTADEDLPEGHLSYDLDFDVGPDPHYLGLLAGSPNANGPGQGNGNWALTNGVKDTDFGKLHVEWESGSVPAFVWPTEGDRIKLWGQWIWDCGHWGQGIQTPTSQQDFAGSVQGTGDYFLPGQIEGPAPSNLRGEQTELHPMQALIVTRHASWSSPTPSTETDAFISNDGTHAYGEEQCASARNAQGPHPQPLPGLASFGADFAACVNDPANEHENIAGRSYEFFIPAPPKPAPRAQLSLREQPMIAPSVYAEQLSQAADGIHVIVRAPDTDDGNTHAFGTRYYVGWSTPDGAVAGSPPTHLRFTLAAITVNNALAEPNPTHPSAAGPPGVGRYNLYMDLNGYWNFIGGRSPEPGDSSWVSGLGSVTDGQSFTNINRTVDFFVPPGAPVRLDISGRECDLPRMDPCLATPEVADSNDHPGHAIAVFANATGALGNHVLDSPNHDPPQSNPGEASPPPDYRIAYSIAQIRDSAAFGSAACLPAPGSTGVGSSSAGGGLGAGNTVIAPAATGCGAGGGGSSTGCAASPPPRSTVARRLRSRHRRIRLRGTATAGRCASVARVQVAVARRAGHRCRFLSRRGRPGKATSCSRPHFLTARGGARWQLSFRRRLRRGRYLVASRAIDNRGRVEVQRGRANVAHLRIR